MSISREPPLPFDESAGFTAPSAFGTYRVLHQIGSGVLGPVFRTFDPQRDRLVAVKAFRLEIVPEQVARLADVLRRLAAGSIPAHDALVPALDAGLEGTTAYLASEYVAAETLDVAMRHLAPAPLERALPILAQIAEGIDAAWAGGIGHGALHPRDVFVAVDSHAVRMTGLGVVSAMESVGLKAPIRRPYTAPERVNGEPWDQRADVYSLGAIAHELLTRRRPAGSGEQDGSLTTGTSPEQRVQIRRVLSAALAEHPQHRFQTARAFTDALAALARGEMPAAWPEVPEAPDAVDVDVDVDVDVEEVEGEAAEVALVQTLPPVAPTLSVEPAEKEQDDSLSLTPVLSPVPVPVPKAAPVPEAMGMWQPGVPAFSSPPPPAEHPSSFPWSALAAVAAAGIMVGVVFGYQFGRRQVSAPAPIVAPSSAATDVPAAPEPASPEGAQATEVAVAPETPQAGPASRGESAPVSSRPASPVVRTAAGPGRLAVRSMPSGALVIVDGRPRGQTPLTISDLRLGEHTIEVARSGFVPHREAFSLNAGGGLRTLSVRLRPGLPMESANPLPRSGGEGIGSVFVDSRPQAARVMIDGRPVGTTPLRLANLGAGTHVVRIERAGYSPYSTTVGVKAGEQTRVTAALEER